MENSATALNGQDLANPLLDPSTTIACMEGVLAAYDLYNTGRYSSPPGYQAVGTFTGWDQYLLDFGQEELFGIVFRSVANPSSLLIAIRGTSSLLDAYEDLWANKVNFRPLNPVAPFPNNVEVASGFNSIYASKGGSMTASMQEQIQTLIAEASDMDPVQEVVVTGHSLGSALCSLLALDLAASMPMLDVYNYNFASPRVGGDIWEATYEKKYNLGSRTYRISNYYDFVPSLPPTVLGYDHVGMNFLISFYVQGAWVPHPISRHSMLNYQVVIRNAVYSNPQQWFGEFADQSSPDSTLTMISDAPQTGEVPEWLVVYREAQENAIDTL